MTSFATTVIINASANTVWRILTDASSYPSWNSSVTKVQGTIALDEKITVRS